MSDPILPLVEFRLQVYGPRGPCLRTLRKRIRQRKIAGGYQDGDGRYWVDMRVFEQHRQRGDVDPWVRKVVGL